MTFRDAILPALAAMRSIGGRLGLREVRAYLRTSTWSGSAVGSGTRTVVDVELLEDGQPPRVRDATRDDVQAFGEVVLGGVTVGPLTPDEVIDQADIEAALTARQTRHVRLTGGRYRTAGQLFRIVGIRRGPLSYTLALQPDT